MQSSSRWQVSLFVVAALLCAGDNARGQQPASGEPSTLKIDTDFPGGSARVLELDQQQRLIRILPAEHQNRGWVCWWYFHVSGIVPGETLSIDVGEAPWATPDRATFSVDRKVWRHSEPGKRQGKRIVYRVPIEASEAWFAWGPPFVPEDAARLVEEVATASPHAKAFELCRTREGRPVPAVQVAQTDGDRQPKYGIWVNARQHAWESGSSWVCRGFTEWIVSDDPRAESLRKQAAITIVPIMDIDNVAIGAGGKNQKPQDHNRDWSAMPHWRSVAAAQQAIEQLDEAGRFDLFIDLHNPGAGDKHPYYYVAPRELLSDLARRNLAGFVAASKLEMTGPLAYRGETRESGANYDPNWRHISKNWVTENTRDHVVAVTLETAWNTPNSTTDNYRRLGQELGLAIERYFRSAPRGEK
jgi:hypothetical protein